MISINNYTAFFHDGSILRIDYLADEIIIFMESAEVDREEITDNIPLSKNDRIRGKLHFVTIEWIKENRKNINDLLKMKHPNAEIFHLTITNNTVEIQIIWNTMPPQPLIQDFSTVEIKAKKIWWENIPDLEGFS